MQGIGAKTDGEEVYGIFNAASASTATAVSLFSKNHAPRVLSATEAVKVLSITGSVHTAATLSLLASAASTVPLFQAECAAAVPFAAEFSVGRFCSVGRVPMVKAGTAQTYLQFNGEILQTQGNEDA